MGPFAEVEFTYLQLQFAVLPSQRTTFRMMGHFITGKLIPFPAGIGTRRRRIPYHADRHQYSRSIASHTIAVINVVAIVLMASDVTGLEDSVV